MLKKIFKVASKSLIVMTLAFMCQNLLAQQLIQTPTDSKDSNSATTTTTAAEASTAAGTGTTCYIESWYPTDTNIYFTSEGGSYTFYYLSTPEECCNFTIDTKNVDDFITVTVNCQDKEITINCAPGSYTDGTLEIANLSFYIQRN